MNAGGAGTRGLSDEEMRAATGKTWAEWHTILDNWGGKEKRLVSIANYLRDEYRLPLIWAQMVAVYYKWGERLKNKPAYTDD